MGLPMCDRPVKGAAPETDVDKESSSNTPMAGPSNSAPNPAATAAARAPLNAELEPTVQWERLHALRNRLVDRMHRLEMDGYLNRINPPTDPATTAAEGGGEPVRTENVSMFDRSPADQLVPAGSRVYETAMTWARTHHRGQNRARDPFAYIRDLPGENHDPDAAEAREGGGTGGRRGDTGAASLNAPRRRSLADYAHEPLLSLDEFLRETRESDLNQNLERPLRDALAAHSRASPPRLPANAERNPETIWNERYSLLPGRPEGVSVANYTGLVSQNPGQVVNAPNQETFETFISHIRRIGHLQDAMLATIRSNAATAALAETAPPTRGDNAASNPRSAAIASATAPGGIVLPPLFRAMPIVSNSQGLTALERAEAAVNEHGGDDDDDDDDANQAALLSTQTPPLSRTAEARLRAMQTRIDILASEFSFLRSTWALSQVESRNFERSLRALPGHVSLRRLTRTRRVEPPLTLGQLDPDETANNLLVRDDFEDEVIPYEPPGVRLARRRRYLDSIADRRRAAAASTTATAGNPAGNVPTTAPTTTTTTTAAPTTYASAPGMPVLVALGAGNYPLATVVAEARERQRQMAQRLEEYRQQQRQPAMMQSRALEIAASQAVGSQATASQPTGSQVTVPQASPDSERDKQKVLLSKMMEEFTVRGMR